jgi:hypothetical protein
VNSVQLVVERDGDALVVRTDAGYRKWLSLGSGWSADLTVSVPTNVKLDVHTGSGGARLSNVGPVVLRSGSGRTFVDGVAGAADVITGSGGAELRNVHGDVSLRTGSGGISLDGVTGSVDVASAGSGGVKASHIGGSLRIGSIGSGDVTADDVGGDFTVGSKGSGSVHYANIKGHVDVPRRRGDG